TRTAVRTLCSGSPVGRRLRRLPPAQRRGRRSREGPPQRNHDRSQADRGTRMIVPSLDAALESAEARAELNKWLAVRSAEDRVEWALEALPGEHVLSSSFGAQAAVSLHMATRQRADLPIVVIDTGYLFPETYRFIDELTERLSLNLKVYRPQIGVAWMEARMGRIWEEGVEGIERYNRLRKVEPMQRALRDLGVGTWIAGLRRSQSRSRAKIDFLERKDGRWKLHPIARSEERRVGKEARAQAWQDRTKRT